MDTYPPRTPHRACPDMKHVEDAIADYGTR